MLKLPSKKVFLIIALALIGCVAVFTIYQKIQDNNFQQRSPAFLDLKLVLTSAIEISDAATPEDVVELRASMMGLNAQTMEELRGKKSLPEHYARGFCIVTSIEQGFPMLHVKNFITDPEEDCEPKRNSRLNVTSIAPQLRTFMSTDKIETLGPNFRTMKVDSWEYHEPFIYIGTTKLYPGPKIKINIPKLILDSLSTLSLSTVNNLGGIMRIVSGEMAYYQLNTKQDIHVLFGAGEVVHALIDPDGKIYVMTSYSTEYFPGMNLRRLNELGKLLNIPTGWSYKNYLLTRPLSIRYREAEGYITPRITDSYGNIYLGFPNQ